MDLENQVRAASRRSEKIGRQLRSWFARTNNGRLESDFESTEVQTLLRQFHKATEMEDKVELIGRLCDLSGQNGDDASIYRDSRIAFLHLVKETPALLEQETFLRFMAEEIETEHLNHLEWDDPDAMIEFYIALYECGIKDEQIDENIRAHARHLLHQEMNRREDANNYEGIGALLRFLPRQVIEESPEIARLQHLVDLYELRRVERHRRWLYGYLIVQVVLVLAIFPYLFKNAENGAIQRQIEKATDVDLQDEGHRFYTYPQALYWTMVTATSIGYGDITPVTNTGRAIAVLLGTMGVITIGVVAGLILRWITPRDFY